MSYGKNLCIICSKLKQQQQICCQEQCLQLFINPTYQYIYNTQYYCVKGLILDNVYIHYSKPFSQMFIEPLMPVDAPISCFFHTEL